MWRIAIAGLLIFSLGAFAADERPNILLAIADDWSYPHASAYGEPEIDTPHFDRVAKEGLLFSQTFTAAPQCSPNRASILTGRYIWQNAEAGTHGSYFPKNLTVFPDLLEASGYALGATGKLWSPGNWKDAGWSRNPAGPEYKGPTVKRRNLPASGISTGDYAANFDTFMEERPKDKPFFFWYGAREPHRKYEWESGVKAGKNPDNARVPGFLPDNDHMRRDMLDYFVEIEYFDRHLGRMLARLGADGELDNTIVIVTGDNGMPFPRAKANLYDHGVRVPMAVRWPKGIEGGMTIDALVSHIDLAPTILAAAGVDVPDSMTGFHYWGNWTGKHVLERDHVLTGRERHSHSRYDNWGYPARAIRTNTHLYIRNFKPDRWPAGDPDRYHDIDDCPAKTWMMDNREDIPELFDAAFGKRPAEELYDVSKDPNCLLNLTIYDGPKKMKGELSNRLDELLTEQGDPRMHGRGDVWESYPRFNRMRPELGGFAEGGVYNPAYQIEEK